MTAGAGRVVIAARRTLQTVTLRCPAQRLFEATPLRPPPARWFMARAVFRGPVQEHIETCVRTALQPAHLEVTNESHGRQTDESHFHVFVVSDAFEGKKPIARHRLVNQLFTGSDFALKFHSLRITA